MGCRRTLGTLARAAIMAGMNAGLSQTRIAHLIGRSPSAVCREIARHTDPDGEYRAEEASKAAQVARRRPKKRLLVRVHSRNPNNSSARRIGALSSRVSQRR